MPNSTPADSQPVKKTAAKKQTARTSPAKGTSVASVISRVARSYNIPPEVALALGMYESGLDPTRIGDQGSSFGIYQLHQGGELGKHDQRWAFNVENNAKQALGVVAQVRAQHPDWDWGSVVAAAQRPADQAAEAAAVNSIVNNYQASGQSAIRYFKSQSASAATTAASYSGGNGSASDLGTPQPLTRKQYLDNPDIAANYGYLSAFLKDPEIGPILAKAAKQGWGANQLLGALSQTKWWKTTSASARSWQAQQKLDPATARQRLNQETKTVQQLAKATLGFAIDPQRAQQIANTAIAANWSAQQVQHAVGAEFHYKQQQDALGGAAGQTVDQFKQMANAYLVPISDHTIGQWTKGVLEGTHQVQDFEHYLRQQALSLYPTLATPLANGETVAQYLNPYAQLAGQTLNINPDSIDWMNPKWAKAINTTTPDGQRAPMSLSDWGTYLRSLPDYQTTPDANSQGASFALNLLNTFGKVST